MGAQLSKLNVPAKRRKRKNIRSDKGGGVIESSKAYSKKDKAIRLTTSAGALSIKVPISPIATRYTHIPRHTPAYPDDRIVPLTSFHEDPKSFSTPSVVSSRSDDQSDLDANDDNSQSLDPEQEYNRQLRQHYVFKQVIGSNIKYDFDTPPKTILDSACGAGFWVFEVAQMFPTSTVVAMNATVATPTSQQRGHSGGTSHLFFPSNVSFAHGDTHSPPLPFPDSTFDLVFQREAGLLLPTLCWHPLIADFHRILKPGGVIHLVEYDLCYPSCGPLTIRANKAIERLTSDLGFTIYYTKLVENCLRQQGFEDVKVQSFPVPIGEWPEDEIKLQQGFLLKSMVLGLLRFAKATMCTFLGIDTENFEEFCGALIAEVEANKGSSEWKVLTGRKSL